MTYTDPMSPTRRALACSAATLLAYLGLVHEMVGARLYPDGPARFGGPIGWHAAGVGLLLLGALIVLALLGRVRAPVRALAAGIGAAGAAVVAGEAYLHGGFHFFAFTTVVAAAFIVIVTPRTAPPPA